MQGRTFLRIMLDNLLVNNPLCKAIKALANFYNEQNFFKSTKLKFIKKMPLNNTEDNLYENKFLFKTTQKSGVNLK